MLFKRGGSGTYRDGALANASHLTNNSVSFIVARSKGQLTFRENSIITYKVVRSIAAMRGSLTSEFWLKKETETAT
jgi:hypothetical protein